MPAASVNGREARAGVGRQLRIQQLQQQWQVKIAALDQAALYQVLTNFSMMPGLLS